MDRETLAARIDHTVLGPETTPAAVERVVDEAVEYGMNACVPPCHAAAARERAPKLTLATVVGFPHGQHATATKVAEAKTAHRHGADELDAVLNVGWLHAGDHERVREELSALVDATPLPVKVIVEAGLLDDAQLHAAGELAAATGAKYLKTSTGFAGGPARTEDVELLNEYRPVKASGGIGDYGTAASMLAAGAERIGASSGVAIVEDFLAHYAGEE